MKLHELVAALKKAPETFPRFVLPDGDHIPAHAHVTEVGHVVKNFIDCGGIISRAESVVLQTHVGKDTDHRLKSDRFVKILQLGNRVVPRGKVDVEVEYDCCVVSQYPISEVKRSGQHLDILLRRNRTQCRAQERLKQKIADGRCFSVTSCC